jgi:hypothetical protein
LLHQSEESPSRTELTAETNATAVTASTWRNSAKLAKLCVKAASAHSATRCPDAPSSKFHLHAGFPGMAIGSSLARAKRRGEAEQVLRTHADNPMPRRVDVRDEHEGDGNNKRQDEQ